MEKITYLKPQKSFEDIYYVNKILPSPFRRWCTVELKIKPSQKFLEEKKQKKNFIWIVYLKIEFYYSGTSSSVNLPILALRKSFKTIKAARSIFGFAFFIRRFLDFAIIWRSIDKLSSSIL